MDKKFKSVEFVVETESEGRLLQKYLEKVQGLSAKAIKKLKYQGAVLLNGQRTLMNVRLQAGDHLTLFYPPQKISPYITPEEIPLAINYEDNEILVVEKPPKLCVHPTKGHPEGTLANGVLYHWQGIGEEASFHLVNRLDQDTSGLILIAKNNYAAQQLFRQQQRQELHKKYLALVEGIIAEEEGTIDLPISRVAGRTTKRFVSIEGLKAVTNFQVLDYLCNKATGQCFTYLAISLETGRTHQIRVHFSHLGHPLAGDDFYGGQTMVGLERQFLHAGYLDFIHPLSKERMEFQASLPTDLQSFLFNLELCD